jgi:hypothetical protein
MSGVVQLTEEILYDYITKILPTPEIKEISNGNDILNSLSYDAEEDIKERVWEAIKEELNYRSVIEAVQDWLKNVCDSDVEEEQDEDENTESCEESSDDE